jgi:exodeoxyribonuclease VII large subunit
MSAFSSIPALHNNPAYSVSELNAQLKRTIEDNFGQVRVRGELSQFKVHGASGHAYFTLKDEKSVLSGVCWRGTVTRLGFKPEDGLEVIATGKLTTYPGKSQYQLVVESMEPAGAGALMALLEKRKAQLLAEGLFAPERKRPLPFMPQTIGIVTSPTGAVIRDILHRLRERMPCHVLVWPVLVQGEGSAEQIARAIAGFNALAPDGAIPRPDLLIVARGGGSLEDLWAFNEEIVVRAAAASEIPLISAVGHETDTTLIDFASDKRAPTPTAAAEIAVPVRAELQLSLENMGSRMQVATHRLLTHRGEHLTALARALPRPEQFLATATQRLDDWAERLGESLPRLCERKTQALALAAAKLTPSLFTTAFAQCEHRVALQSERLQDRLQRALRSKEDMVHQLSRMLDALDARAVMNRGFALVRGKNGTLITHAAQAEKRMEIQWTDGSVTVQQSVDGKQGSLF